MEDDDSSSSDSDTKPALPGSKRRKLALDTPTTFGRLSKWLSTTTDTSESDSLYNCTTNRHTLVDVVKYEYIYPLIRQYVPLYEHLEIVNKTKISGPIKTASDFNPKSFVWPLHLRNNKKTNFKNPSSNGTSTTSTFLPEPLCNFIQEKGISNNVVHESNAFIEVFLTHLIKDCSETLQGVKEGNNNHFEVLPNHEKKPVANWKFVLSNVMHSDALSRETKERITTRLEKMYP